MLNYGYRWPILSPNSDVHVANGTNGCRQSTIITDAKLANIYQIDCPQVPLRAADATLEQSQGLGEYTEKLLKTVGVTPELYVAAKAFAGLAPTCNCAARKEWLNKVSDWLRGESAA